MTRSTGLRRILAMFTVFGALLLTGCAPSVVGKWEGNIASANSSLEFKQDGKFEQQTSAPIVGTISATGTYKVEGDKVDFKTDDITAGGKSIKGMLPPQLTQQLMNQSATFKIEGDKLTLNTGKGSATLTRAKQ